MAKYQFQISNDGSTAEAALKVLAMLQDKDYSVSVDSDKHILTITAGEKDTQRNAIKKELKKSRWKLFWRSAWKRICNWIARKGYWLVVLIGAPIFVLNCNGDIELEIMTSIWIDVMIITSSIG